MQSQGFPDVAVAGEAASAPALLSRQSVVVGISDGATVVDSSAPPPTLQKAAVKPAATRAAAAPPTAAVVHDDAGLMPAGSAMLGWVLRPSVHLSLCLSSDELTLPLL